MRHPLIILVLSAFQVTLGQVQGPITQDFQTWLGSNGYDASQFARTDIAQVYGSYGGRTSSGQRVTKQPVVFVHGNSDEALKNPNNANPMYAKYQTGWTSSIQYFQSQGYTSAELYATTWGPANDALAQQQTHNCGYVMKIRKFLEAVLAYTGASKIDVISHSMGVTIARKAIKGGSLTDETGANCNIGVPLTSAVDTFLGISGANYGLCNCQYATMMPTCNKKTGFYPGMTCGGQYICMYVFGQCTQTSYSQYMTDLNSDSSGYEGAHRYAFWSTADELIGNQDKCWGQPTSRYPGMQSKKVFSTLMHMQTKDNTASDQYQAVVNHQLSAHN